MNDQRSLAPALIASLFVAASSGCGGAGAPQLPVANTDAAATPPGDAAPSPTAQPEPTQPETAPDADAAAREREQALQEREDALAQREARLAEQQAAAAKRTAATRKPTTYAATPQRTAAAPAASRAATPARAPAQPIVVPAGTPLSLTLASEVSTRTAVVGNRVDAQLASDLIIDGRRAVAAGALVHGSVTQVVSGSHHIGGTPTLALAFDTLEVRNGVSVPISGTVLRQGNSETARDTAKIVGGAAVGAVIGHQIDDDKGKIIGGLLGGAAGAVAAKKTGGDIDLPAGTPLSVTVDASFEVKN